MYLSDCENVSLPYDTSDPPGHISLNSKGIKGGCDAQRSKRGVKV